MSEAATVEPALYRPGATWVARLLNAVRRPLVQLWVAKSSEQLDSVPRPTDLPHAHAPGGNPIRVLVVGSGIAVGWGVLSHDLALPGSLARVLAAQTGRGCEVDLVADHDLSITGALALLAPLDLSRYDAIVMTLGVNDALSLTPVGLWEKNLRRVVATIADRASQAQFVLTGVQSIRSIPTFAGRLGAIADSHAASMNTISKRVCGEFGRAHMLQLSVPVKADPTRHRGSKDYLRWARELAPLLLTGVVADPTADANRDRVAEGNERAEERRQSAVDRLNVTHRPSDERLRFLVAAAQRGLRSDAAMFTVLDGTRQINVVVVGSLITEIPREHSFCEETIKHSDGLLVLDAREDERFSDNPYVVGMPHMRFYAGYPIETVSGERIGALCVAGSSPRSESDVDLALLKELAVLVQHDLWQYWECLDN